MLSTGPFGNSITIDWSLIGGADGCDSRKVKFLQIDGHGLIGLTQPDTDHAKEKKERHTGVPRRSR